MRRFPILPTLVVLLAVGAMIGLGLWQLQRAQWKEGLLARYRAAATAPPLAGLPAGPFPDSLGFRKASLHCVVAGAPIQLGGQGPNGAAGFRSILPCRLADGREMLADIGWQRVGSALAVPASGARLSSAGVLVPDEVLAQRFADRPVKPMPWLIVLETPQPGFAPSKPPAIDTIPNNHRGYAVQWFLFAAVALAIYGIAIRRRWLDR